MANNNRSAACTVTIRFKNGTSTDIHVLVVDIKKVVDKFDGYIHVSGTNYIINTVMIKDITIHK